MAARTDQANLILTINGQQATGTLRDMQRQSRDLRRLLERLPVDSEEFKKTQAELLKVNTKIKELRDGMTNLRAETGAWGLAMSVAGGIIAGLNLQSLLGQLQQWLGSLFGIGTALDAMQQKTRTVFGEAETVVKAFAEANARSLGLAQQQYINLATSAGDLLKPMGFTEEAVANLSVALTDQAGILAEWSLGKVNSEQASEILTKALLGERDALNTLGIDIKDSLIQEEIKRKGLDELTGASRRQAEALITLEQITKQSASANEAFARNTDSNARKQAELRARLAEISQTAARALVPAFSAALTVGLRLVDWSVRFAQGLAAIPSFISENRVAIGALIVALVSLNAQGIAAAANALRMAAAQRAATIATNAQALAQRALNFVLNANPIGLVITALATLAGVFVTAYNRSETFRRIVSGTFEAITVQVRNAIGFFADLGKGLVSLFEGNFQAAGDAFSNAFSRLNPFQVGAQMKEGFVRGYQSVKSPPAETIKGDEQGAEAEGNKVGQAMSRGFEAQFENLQKTGERGADTLAKAAKDALELRLKEIEATFLKEEIVADRALFNREISEGEHGKRMLLLQEQQYVDQLVAFQRFNQEESREALEAMRKLQEIRAQLNPAGIDNFSALPARQPGQVTSQTSPLVKQADVAAADDEVKILQDKLARVVDLEQNNEVLRLEMLRNSINNRLQLLRDNGLTETQEYQNTLDAKVKADEQYQNTIIENERRTAELKQRIGEASLDAASDFFGAFADLLSQDEKARKKNAAAIKAFQTAQVIVDGVQEVQKIWAQSAQLGPIAGPIIGAILTAVAVGRTVLAIQKINAAKFAGGGYTGDSAMPPDSSGHRPVGVVHEREWVAPRWMVESPIISPMIRRLESLRLQGGAYTTIQRGFADGGYATTPTPAVSGTPLPGVQPEMIAAFMSMTDEVRGLRADVRAQRQALKAYVVYTEIEKAGSDLNTIREDASI